MDPEQEKLICSEITYSDVQALNNNIFNELSNLLLTVSNLLLYVNIRSMDANFVKLELFIESLTKKPMVIVCVEIWNLECRQYYQLHGYKVYYNKQIK